jgi:hypothetical protein
MLLLDVRTAAAAVVLSLTATQKWALLSSFSNKESLKPVDLIFELNLLWQEGQLQSSGCSRCQTKPHSHAKLSSAVSHPMYLMTGLMTLAEAGLFTCCGDE